MNRHLFLWRATRRVIQGATALALVLLSIGFVAGPPVARAAALVPGGQDWPTYLHDVQRASASGETILSTANAAQLAKKWSFQTGGVIASSATVVAGVVYIASWDGYEYALDAMTGAMKWKTFLGTTTANPICVPPSLGVSSAAAVQDGVVYLGGGDSFWYALDASTGAVLWKVFTGDNSAASGHYNWSSPLLYNGFAYIGVASEGDCPLVQGQLLQVSLSTHQIVKTLNMVPDGQVGGGIWTTPSIDTATNTIFVDTGTENLTTQTWAQAFLAIDATTLTVKESWKLPESEAVLDSDFSTSPTLFTDAAGDPLVAAINKNGQAYAFNRNNLAAGPVWQTPIADGGDCPTCGESSVSSGAFGGGRLYLAGETTTINGKGYQGSVRALDPATGQVLWAHGTLGPVIGALAYTNGLVIAGAGDTLEVLDAATGKRLYSYQLRGGIFSSPSISQGQIYIGDLFGNVYAFGLGTPMTPPPDPQCPNGWTCQDIGNPAPAGTETVAAGTWDVAAGGAGVAGASDQFRLLSETTTGDVQITAQVTAQPAGAASQAGLMLRQDNTPGSPYYAVFLTPNNGLQVQYRSAFGGATTVLNQTTTGGLPLFLEIQRVGDQFQVGTSTDGTTYTLVPASTALFAMPTLLLTGLAASTGLNGLAGTTTYKNVALSAPGNPPGPPASPSPCPANWSCSDIGNPLVIGDQTLNNGTWTVKGAGGDIWGTSDQFHFVWQTLAADGTISAHLLSQTNTDPAAKAGIMLRQNASATSAYYAAVATPGQGIIVQYRFADDRSSAKAITISGSVPASLAISRSGNSFTTYSSSDGATWTPIGQSTVTIPMTGSVLAGLAVTSHDATTLGTATYDTVTLSNTAPPPPNLCPSGWTCTDIGFPTPAGEQALTNGNWVIEGGGGDIWNTVDQFHFVSQALAGDGSISAHISSQENTNAWAKAGVMLRQSTNSGDPYYAVYVTPSNGVVVQYRATAGALAQQAAAISGAAPAYLKVARAGDTFTAYTSADGMAWTPIAGSSVTITMTSSMLAGMAVTSHEPAELSTVDYDSVTIAPVTSAACPATWTCGDIGNPALAGGQAVNNGVWTVQGAGGDIWGTSDEFHYVWQALAGDGSVSARVVSQSDTDPWAKAGVMLRQDNSADAPYYAVYVTPGNGIVVQYRAAAGGNAAMISSLAGSAPAYVEVTRSGSTFTAATSTNGTTWTPIAGSDVTITMPASILAGLAVTSHNVTIASTVTFDTVSVTPSSPPPPGCPTSWNCGDIGAPALPGSQSLSNGSWAIQGSGGDIWGTSDAFHYVWQTLAADGTISARVVSQSNTDPWAKAGVMLRQSANANAAYYAVYVTPGHGLAVQYRAAAGASAVMLVGTAGAPPAYVQVARSGSTFTTYTSTNGTTWTPLSGSSVTLSLSGTLLAGLAVTAHNVDALSAVTFDTVNISTAAPPPPNACPTTWNCADIGGATPGGEQLLNAGTWNVQGGGGDIWGASDQFHYIWQALAGDGSVSARVVSQSNTDPWAKAGVMLRQSNSPDAAYYAAYLTPGNGLAVQYRTATGAQAAMSVDLAGAPPLYLRVGRVGTTFTAYTSTDGTTWTAIAGSTITLSMTGTLLAGLAVTSHNGSALSAVTFDTVTIG